MKTCSNCKREKSYSEFHAKAESSDGHSSWCKDCRKHYSDKTYPKKRIKDIERRVKELKCRMLPYDSRKGVEKLHKLVFIHGYAAGIYATKKMPEINAPQGGCVLHGHTHGIQHTTIARLGKAEGRGVGCLADLNPEYNRHQTACLVHQHGFAYGIVGASGYEVFQAKPDKEGTWHVAETLTTL